MTTDPTNSPQIEYYDKSFLSIPEQVNKLIHDKGLLVQDKTTASALLRRVGYYRLSAYWHFFRDLSTPEKVKTGISLETVESLYLFDQELRQRIAIGTGIVEIALRFHLGHQLGRTDAFAHLDPERLDESWTRTKASQHPVLGRMRWPESEHARFTKKVLESEKISSESFVDHFRKKYDKPYLPSWVATELFSFGMLTALYDGCKQEDKRRVASAFGFVNIKEVPKEGDLSSVLNHLRYVRNLCAHHSRLWNRGIDTPIPKLDFIEELGHLDSYKDGHQPRVYDTLALLAYLIGQLEPSSSWRIETLQFIEQKMVAELKLDLSEMGFPEDWQLKAIWLPTYTPSYQDLHEKLALFEHVAHLPEDEAASSFRLRGEDPANDSRSARKSRSRYARKRGALIGIRVNDQILVPIFQIDSQAADLHQVVANTNVRFFQTSKLDPHDELNHITALQWWLSELPEFSGHSLYQLYVSSTLVEDHISTALGKLMA